MCVSISSSVRKLLLTSRYQQHHETSQAFIRSLEFLAPSKHSIEAMRSHPIYSAFDRRWQLPVYFQLRWKEIVGKLEEVLSTTRIDLSTAGGMFINTFPYSA